jgi:hypothetical protein
MAPNLLIYILCKELFVIRHNIGRSKGSVKIQEKKISDVFYWMVPWVLLLEVSQIKYIRTIQIGKNH